MVAAIEEDGKPEGGADLNRLNRGRNRISISAQDQRQAVWIFPIVGSWQRPTVGGRDSGASSMTLVKFLCFQIPRRFMSRTWNGGVRCATRPYTIGIRTSICVLLDG